MCFLQYSSVHRGMPGLCAFVLRFAELARLHVAEIILIRDERDTDRREAHVDVITSNREDRHVFIIRAGASICATQNTLVCFFSNFILRDRARRPLYFQDGKEFSQRDARAKYYTRANASNKIALFASEISNISLCLHYS